MYIIFSSFNRKYLKLPFINWYILNFAMKLINVDKGADLQDYIYILGWKFAFCKGFWQVAYYFISIFIFVLHCSSGLAVLLITVH